MADNGDLLLMADPVNNYSFTSNVDFKVTQVAPNSDLHFDWSQLSIDFLGHPIDPQADVAMVFLALLQLSPEDFKAALNADERLNPYVNGALALYTNGALTEGSIYEASIPGTNTPASQEDIAPYLDPESYDPANHTYALLVQDSTDVLVGIRMVQALQLDPNSFTTDITITNDDASLMSDPNLTDLVPVKVPSGEANITVDWSQMQVNGLGNEWTERAIDGVLLGHYSLTPAELEDKFLDLELVADQLFRGTVEAGSVQSLSALTDENGQPFTGIDDTGTWVLALTCPAPDCVNPAPWYLTILQPCGS